LKEFHLMLHKECPSRCRTARTCGQGVRAQQQESIPQPPHPGQPYTVYLSILEHRIKLGIHGTQLVCGIQQQLLPKTAVHRQLDRIRGTKPKHLDTTTIPALLLINLDTTRLFHEFPSLHTAQFRRCAFRTTRQTGCNTITSMDSVSCTSLGTNSLPSVKNRLWSCGDRFTVGKKPSGSGYLDDPQDSMPFGGLSRVDSFPFNLAAAC
jgi:hypothetical protein